MGFIASSSTVTVDAELTELGRKLINRSLLGTESISKSRIVKFGFGDSDANYSGVTDGESNTLPTGFVPEASAYRPAVRSAIPKIGTVRPGRALITSSVGNNTVWNIKSSEQLDAFSNPTFSTKASTFSIEVTTEWPVGTTINEDYRWYIDPIDDDFDNVFDSSVVKNKITLSVKPNVSRALIGYNNTSFIVSCIGLITGAKYGISVRIKNTLDVNVVGNESGV